ncbi:fasciclin domain family protein [Phlyctema vagabunda]|uniref:Fasciclin domain family protein n=1 Tax=Phlyctema vagabunda TaxID=108571 RepID=A0ABR4PQ82_9HELO
MKFINLLPLAAVSSAFVIPDEQMTNQLIVQSKDTPKSFFDRLPNKEGILVGVEDAVDRAVSAAENAIDKAINVASEFSSNIKPTFSCFNALTAFDVDGWLQSADTMLPFDESMLEHGKPPHHKPPHHKKPHHDHKPNLTVYELIATSKYTTKLAKLINEYPDLVETLNGTAANYTVFAPIDKAFEKIPEGHKPSKELIKKVLLYHVSPDFYPASRVLVTHTIPTALEEEALGGEAQRLRVGLGLKGLAVNFYSRVVAINIFGTNGVIHGVESLLLPPPPALKIIELLPGEFSTLNLALEKTGLFEEIKDGAHEGGTFFAPNNYAFQKLGPKINAFLFSTYGQKYLKALLKYHVVANQTLYSDAFYKAKDASSAVNDEVSTEDIPKGYFHIDLPTLLEEKSLAIDIGRWGGFITIKINGFSSVAIQDGLARDGVIHVLSAVLIPPKTPGGAQYAGEEMEVDDLKARLGGYLDQEDFHDL